MTKKITFVNKQSLKEFQSLPYNIQQQFMNDLRYVSQNEKPLSDIKHLSQTVGQGVIELIENGKPAYRTLYVDKFEGHVYVLQSFTKTTDGVDHQAMATAKLRYKTLKAGLGKSK